MRPKHPRVLILLGWHEDRVYRGIARFAMKAGWHLCNDAAREKVIPWGWQGHGILSWLGAGDELAEFTLKAKKPTVDFSYRRPELPFAHVLTDQEASAKLVAEHFLIRGFKHFYFYSSQANWAAYETGTAYTANLRAAGHTCTWIRWDESPSFSTGHVGWRDKRRWLAAKLKSAPKPLALYACDDTCALEVVETCEDTGLRVPDDVSVIGMGDSLPAVEAMRTPISSVDQSFETLGYRGAELLDEIMRGKQVPSAPIRIPPTGLVTRKSSDLLAVGHPNIARCLRYIWENCHKPIGVDDLAKVAGMSRSGLHKAFLYHIGRAPGTELHRVRIEAAKRMLAQTGMKLEEIAEKSGYQSANSFWVAFRQSTGMSPKQYQTKFYI